MTQSDTDNEHGAESSEVLSNAEVGALLEGVADGVVPTEEGVTPSGEVSAFEIRSSRNVSSYCPASLVNVYSRLTRMLQAGLYDLLRRDIRVELESVRRQRYDEYISTLQKPICVHSVVEKSLPGTALIVLDAPLIHGFVDFFFGGAGESGGVAEERDPTPAELRMSEVLLDQILNKLSQAWSTVDNLQFATRGCETDPSLVTVAAQPESMLVARLTVDMDGAAGDCHIAMPTSMLDPVRAKLEASSQGSLGGRDRFHQVMRQQLRRVPVSLHGSLCEVGLTLRELLSMSPGDVIPVDLPRQVTLCVDTIPVVSGRFGTSRGHNAISTQCRPGEVAESNDSSEGTQ